MALSLILVINKEYDALDCVITHEMGSKISDKSHGPRLMSDGQCHSR